MIIKQCNGYELVKAQPNTSEDYFNRSMVTYIIAEEERTLSLLYVRYFDEQLAQLTPFAGNALFEIENENIGCKEIAALAYLLKKSDATSRKRVYINTIEEFVALFDEQTIKRSAQIMTECRKNGSAEVKEENKAAYT